MEAYTCLLILIYFVYFLTRNMGRNIDKSDNIFLFISFLAVFLFCALRDYTVGRDIPGYKDVYESSANYGWMDTTWIYMESGYIFLMKLCNSLGMSFRLFFCLIYAIMIYPVYKTIKHYSIDPLLSVIIFVCYQYLIFDMTGIRQGLAASICLLALPFAQRQKKKDWIIFVAIVIIATSIHKSSIVFCAVPFILNLKYNIKTFILMTFAIILAQFFQGQALIILREEGLTSLVFESSALMGWSLVFLVLLVLFLMFTANVLSKRKLNTNDKDSAMLNLKQYTLLMIVSIIVTLLFNGSTLLRSTMFYTLFMICSIPNAISVYHRSIQPSLKIIFHVLMIYILYFLYLIPNNFDLVPYKIGADLPF